MQETPDILKKIIFRKHQEVAARKAAMPARLLEQQAAKAPPVRGFRKALHAKVAKGDAAVIAEIKKASPSQGVIRESFEPAQIARSYEAGGAACLSVLTDVDFFQGSDDDLRAAREACGLPVLRKDFVVDPWQLLEARSLGADCILLIAACLSTAEMIALHQRTLDLGMDSLIEVHNRAEMERALEVGGTLLGINNRDLHSFSVDLNTTRALMSMAPADSLLVTESGIRNAADVAKLRDWGIHAFLVGESFMRVPEPGERLAEWFATRPESAVAL